MARRVGWSPEALEDLEAIAAYIERDSEDERVLVVAIVHGSRLLQPFLQRVEGDKTRGE